LLACFAALCFCVATVLCVGSQASAQSTTDGAIGAPQSTLPRCRSQREKSSQRTPAPTPYRPPPPTTPLLPHRQLAPAEYTVTVEATGMAPFTAEHVTVLIGSVTELTRS